MGSYKQSSSEYSKSVCIIILTHNNVSDTIECLNSVVNLQGESYSVLIVDNASTDDTVKIVREEYPNLSLVQLEENIGFSAGINEGIRWGWKRKFDYYFILNNDTTVDKGMLQELLDFADSTNDSAMIMPRIFFYSSLRGGNRSNIWSDGGYLRKFPPSIKLKDTRKSVDFNSPRKIDYAPFCGILIPRDVIESVGLLDTSYFFFYEDWDYCERVRANGFNIWCVPDAVMAHKVSRTIKKSSHKYWLEMGQSTIKFFRQHFSLIIAFVHIKYIIGRDFIINIKNVKNLPSYIKGILLGLFQPFNEIIYLDDKGTTKEEK